jgi:hypothetical protein
MAATGLLFRRIVIGMGRAPILESLHMFRDGMADEFGERNTRCLRRLLHLIAEAARNTSANDIGICTPAIVKVDCVQQVEPPRSPPINYGDILLGWGVALHPLSWNFWNFWN